MTKSSFNILVDEAKSHGWQVPIHVTGKAWQDAVEPKHGELREERIQLLLTTLTAAAKGQRRKFIKFTVPATPLRPYSYTMMAALCGQGAGKHILVALLSEAKSLAGKLAL